MQAYATAHSFPRPRLDGAARATRGFTLIELVIVMAVIAILTAIAVPAYSDSVRKSRRGAAKSLMVDIAQRYERFHTVNNTYAGAFALVVPAGDRQSPNTGGAAAYVITNPVEAANTFTLQATPQPGQDRDVRCMTLTLDQAGVKTESGTGILSDCW